MHDRPAEEEDEGGAIWLTVGDLMSGLLLVFVLAFAAAMLQLHTLIDEAEDKHVVIIRALKESLAEAGIQAETDPETGDISILDNDLFFDQGRATLKPKGREYLDRFIPVYADVIFANPVHAEEITRVIVEGHTSSEGAEAANLYLSLQRSYAVSNYVLSTMEFDHKQAFLQKMQPSGRGEAEASTSEDAADRRVVFRMQFKGEDWSVWAEKVGREGSR